MSEPSAESGDAASDTAGERAAGGSDVPESREAGADGADAPRTASDGVEDGPAEATSPGRVESRWWLGVVAMPVVTVIEATLGFFLVGFAAESVQGGLDPVMLLVPASPFLAVAVLVRLLLPVALYRDAQRVRAAGLDWQPDPANWAFLGLGLIVVPLLDGAIAVIYLRRRLRATA